MGVGHAGPVAGVIEFVLYEGAELDFVSNSASRACLLAERESGYNPIMDPKPNVPPAPVHDDTLIDWFLALDPAERLAELESRVAFFNSVTHDDDAKLPADTGTA